MLCIVSAMGQHQETESHATEDTVVPIPDANRALPAIKVEEPEERSSCDSVPLEEHTVAEKNDRSVTENVDTKQSVEPNEQEEQALMNEVGAFVQNGNVLQTKEAEIANDEGNEADDEDEDEGEDEDEYDGEYDGEDDGEDHESDVESSGPPRDIIAQEAQVKKKKRRGPAKTAQEWFDRQHEIEDTKRAAKYGRKRASKAALHNPKPSKIPKKNQFMGRWKDDKVSQARAKLISGTTGNFEVAFVSGEAPSMGAIKARTKASQFKQIEANIPEGCDSRRTATQEKDLNEAFSCFGYKKIQAVDGKWLFKGMKTSLHSYQLTLAAWMAKRECGRVAPWGGLVADEMGMGKTVVSLFLIEGNPAPREQSCKATLVIVPNRSLAIQWLQETRKHSSDNTADKTVLYPGQEKGDKGFYERKNLVITTYKEVLRQWIDRPELENLKNKHDGDGDGFHRELESKVGVLFHVNWHRVILDEAHTIKNITAKTTEAACFLKSNFRWTLSGTPLANTAKELYPYLKFLGCLFTSTQRDFDEKYLSGPEGRANYEALVSLIMYRRTKKDTMLGCKILDIPEREVVDLWIPLSKEEQLITDAISSHYENAAVKASNGDRKDKNGNRVLTQKERDEQMAAIRAMYTMLRQGCSHLFNLEPWLRKTFPIYHLEILTEELEKNGGQITMLDHLCGAASSQMSQFSDGLKALRKLQNNTLSGFVELSKLFSLIESGKRSQEQNCPICGQTPLVPSHSDCCHLYCEKCVLKKMKKSATKSFKCLHPGCKQLIKDFDDLHTLDTVFHTVERKPWDRENEAARDSNNVGLIRDRGKNGMFATSEDQETLWTPPSSKLTATMAVLLDWKQKYPDDKVIVFTTFVMTGKVLGRMLQLAGINFLYFYGELTQVQKDKAILDFKESPEQKIMIMGLKCGALGLNLTCANRVIIVDPWWNNTVEEQAFGRVWRMGQNKISHLVRIKTDSPVDQRIAKLQKEKSLDVNRALQDDGFTPVEIDNHRLRELFSVPGTPDEDSDRD